MPPAGLLFRLEKAYGSGGGMQGNETEPSRARSAAAPLIAQRKSFNPNSSTQWSPFLPHTQPQPERT